MKAKIYTLIAAFGLAFTPAITNADDEGWAALGGFITGAIFTNISHQRDHSVRHYGGDYRGGGYYSEVRAYHGRPSGHYQYRIVKDWVPGYWAYESDGCGLDRRHWHKGYYTRKKVKVWVESPRKIYYSRPSYTCRY